jgi:hypothetical protein
MSRVTQRRMSAVLATLVVLALASPAAAEDRSEREPVVPTSMVREAERKGAVRAIVRLDQPFTPEGSLGTAGVSGQRESIHDMRSRLLDQLAGTSFRVVRRYPSIPYVALELTPEALRRVEASSLVAEVDRDRLAAPALAESSPLVQANELWESSFTGSGWTVAVLDTGIEKTHSFLSGKVIEEACFALGSDGIAGAGDCPNGTSSQLGSGAGVPCAYATLCFHGTHVGGIAAGSGPSFSGVAKGANLMSVQVFSRFTGASCGPSPSPCPLSWTSDQIAGLQRVHTLATTTPTQFASVNMSLGGGQFFSNCDSSQSATKAAIDNLRSVGVATVIASGNNGYTNAIGAPACISTSVSVGSTTKSDQISSFSNMSDQVSLLAPGSNINSSTTGGGFTAASGTSMATPHVAGAWSLMKQLTPTADVPTVLASLQSTGLPVTDSRPGGTVTKNRIRLGLAAGFRTLTVSKSGPGAGTVASAPAGITCGSDCLKMVPGGTVISLTATPDSGSAFAGWSGACSGAGACDVTMDADKAVTASFTVDTSPKTLTVNKIGTGSGTVSSAPAGIDCGVDCSESYPHGTVVTLTATPDAATSVISGWSGGGCSGLGPCLATMDADKAVTATFTLIPRTLLVTKSGSGSGTVSSAPAGISCGGDCSESSAHGTVMVLTAAPDAGSTFAGWFGGGCSGNGACAVTLDGDKTVSATFETAPPQAKSVGLKAKDKKVEQGRRTRLTAVVAPCGGHEGDLVEFYRGSKKIASRATDGSCTATLRVRISKTATFRAVSPQQDADHVAGTSNTVRIRAV